MNRTPKTQASKPGPNANGKTPVAPMAQTIRYVTITIPIVESFPVDSAGNVNDGGLGFIETRLGRGPAQGMYRVLLALQSMLTTSRQTIPDGALAPHKEQVSSTDVARYLFRMVEEAASQVDVGTQPSGINRINRDHRDRSEPHAGARRM